MSNDASLPVEKRYGYTSVMDAAVRIMREEGPTAFFKGASPFAIRAMVVGGTQVLATECRQRTTRDPD